MFNLLFLAATFISTQIIPTDKIIITHLSDGFMGYEQIVKPTKDALFNYNQVYLLDSQTGNLQIDEGNIVYSGSGEFYKSQISLDEKEITISGLYFKACVTNTILSVIDINEEKEFKIIFPTQLILHGISRTLYDQWQSNWKDRFIKGYILPHFELRLPEDIDYSVTEVKGNIILNINQT